jgi:hypothetical protein
MRISLGFSQLKMKNTEKYAKKMDKNTIRGSKILKTRKIVPDTS